MFTGSARELYTRRADQYVAFVTMFRHQAGIAAVLKDSKLLRDGMRVLDAGCGTGFATFALLDAARSCKVAPQRVDAFDLTPAMLSRFDAVRRDRALANVNLCCADVLHLDALPAEWIGHDLIVSVSMLEYVLPAALPEALAALRARLAPAGQLLAVLTRKNALTRWLIGRWWNAHRYTRADLRSAFAAAGFADVRFSGYPARYFWLGLSNHVTIAGG